MRGRSPLLIGAVALAALAIFAVVFTLLAERGLWPAPPPGALHDTDLWTGLAVGAVLLFMLLHRAMKPPAVEDGTGRRGDGETGREERDGETGSTES